jgi:hypothetical protein
MPVGAAHLAVVMVATTALWFGGAKRDAVAELSLVAQVGCLVLFGILSRALYGTLLKFREHQARQAARATKVQ